MHANRAGLLFCLLAVGAIVYLPRYNANPGYIRSMAGLMVLRDLKDAELSGNIVVTPLSSPGISHVTLSARAFKLSSDGGLLTEEVTNLAYSLTTKSHCMELEPGCMSIREKTIQKAVSIKVTM